MLGSENTATAGGEPGGRRTPSRGRNSSNTCTRGDIVSLLWISGPRIFYLLHTAIRAKNFDFHDFREEQGRSVFGLLVNIPPAYNNTIIADIL